MSYKLYELLVKGKPDQLTTRYWAYFSQCLGVDLSMFQWKVNGEAVWTSPDGESLDAVWLEKYFNCAGAVAGRIRNGKIIIAPRPSRTGNLNQYGDGEDGIGITRNGIQIEGENGDAERICIGYNCSTRFADLDLLYYPDVLSRVDDAINALLKWSKAAPLIGVPDSAVQKQVDDIIEDLMEGNPQTVVDGNLFDKIKQSGSEGVYSVDISKPERVALLQYLSELHDVLYRRYYTLRGLDTHKTSKHAQVTADEADGQEYLSWIMPMDRLKCRIAWCDLMNQNDDGITIEVDFAEPWKSMFEAFMRRLHEQPEEEGGEPDADQDNPDGADPEEPDNSGDGSESE